jgi:hypothetical protein
VRTYSAGNVRNPFILVMDARSISFQIWIVIVIKINTIAKIVFQEMLNKLNYIGYLKEDDN